MDRPTRPKDDLFDNSTMTFGEHLDELRIALGKAILWLGLGLLVGLLFADRVVRYAQEPLKDAIQKFNVDRDLAKLGFDPDSGDVAGLRQMLAENGLMWELVYDLPDDALAHAGLTAEALATGGNQRVQMVELLSKLPDPGQLTPKLQLRRHEIGLSALKIEEPFMIWIKGGLIVGAVIASPMIFYHLWGFVAAGLHTHERRYVYLYMPISVLLFVSGVCLAFYFVLDFVLGFLLKFNGHLDVAVEPRLNYYINFVLLLPLGFGLAFQLPLVMLFLERIGLISVQAYLRSWRIAVLLIAVMAMLVTPPDLTSMVALMIPLIGLYFLGIVMCKLLPKGRGLGADAYDPQ